MTKASVHFEVQTYKGGNWSVDTVCHDERTALSTAKHVMQETSPKAVKVIRVEFDEAEAVYLDREVYYDGEKVAARGSGEENTVRPVCQHTADLLTIESRRSIRRLLEKQLEHWAITPLELLHSEENLRRLADTGTILQGVIQRAAIAQIKDTGQKVNERVLELYELNGNLQKQLKAEFNEVTVPTIDGNDLRPVFDEAAKTGKADRILLIAICRHMTLLKTRKEKLARLLQFLAHNDDEDILAVLDQFLADYFDVPDFMMAILGPSPNLGTAVLNVINFIAGKPNPNAERPLETKALSSYVAAGRLPLCRSILLGKIQRILQGANSFDPDDSFRNIRFHREILDALDPPGGPSLVTPDMEYSLGIRCERSIGSQTIMKLLQNCDDPWQRVDRLLDISAGIIGTSGQRLIANQILPILTSTANETLFITNAHPITVRFQTLRKLQFKARKSALQDFQRKRISERLDALAVGISEKHKVIETLTRSRSDIVGKVTALLNFMAKNMLTSGDATRQFQAAVRNLMRNSEFAAALTGTGQDKAEQAKTLRALHQLLEKVRL